MKPEFREALAAARELRAVPKDLAFLIDRYGAEAAQFAIAQWELRRRAKAKFVRAEEMLFVREALEQATHERISAYHASLFPEGETVVDMTAGIGADLIALSARGPAVGYELDPERAEYARENVTVHGQRADVMVVDSLTGDLGRFAFVDPARRSEGKRTAALRDFAPDPYVLAERFRSLERGVMKLGPGTPDADLAALSDHIEFISFGGECREALLVFGAEPWRGAVRVETGSRLPSGPPPIEGEVGAWLFDPDPAASRAGATGELARRYGLSGLGGYLSGSDRVTDEWLQAYEVLWTGRPDVSDLNQALRKLRSRVFEAKSRAPGFDAQRLFAKLKPSGDRLVSLVVWREGKRVVAALAEGRIHGARASARVSG